METRVLIDVLGILCLMVIVSIMFLTYPRECEVLEDNKIEIKRCYEVISH